MHLEGSCHCGAVRFSVEAPHAVPYNQCYCTICRKTSGSGGYSVNIGAVADSLKVDGQENVSTYASSPRMERTFCKVCGSALWGYSPSWPDLIHPLASAIDTPLPAPPERTHLMLSSRAPWVVPQINPEDKSFETYPDESLAAWHDRLGMTS